MIRKDNLLPHETEEQLLQQVHRLQVLHEIDHAALSIQSEYETSAAALRYIAPLVPGYRLSIVCTVDPDSGLVKRLASDGDMQGFEHLFEGQQFSHTIPTSAVGELEGLQNKQPLIVQDLQALPELGLAGRLMTENGMRAMLAAPLCWDGELHGLLMLYSTIPDVFPVERAQIAQEIADSLAVAIQQALCDRLSSNVARKPK